MLEKEPPCKSGFLQGSSDVRSRARTLPVTEDILVKWRLLLEDGRKTGHTFSQPDSLIAATAADHGMTVVTRDRSQFDKARVPVINPWES